jgi:hypothetical protein
MKTHHEVIRDFVHHNGKKATGRYVVSNPFGLYSRYGPRAAGPTAPLLPLAVRPRSGGIVVNGDSLVWPICGYQDCLLKEAAAGREPFAVVPFNAITAALTNGQVNEWARAPFTFTEVRREVHVVVPSRGETWREVEMKDKYGRTQTRNVHTLGDSVVRVQKHLYLSGVDETGRGRGTYFFAQLRRPGTPRSVEDAYNFLKPDAVREAEARGTSVRRQGEWFAIPTTLTTGQLEADIQRGWAVRQLNHVLGRDGHHRLDEVVQYERGPRKGEVYGRGVLRHTANEHYDLDLGFRWHQIVHNVQGRAYSVQGNFD